jgi:hypothetical protein
VSIQLYLNEPEPQYVSDDREFHLILWIWRREKTQLFLSYDYIHVLLSYLQLDLFVYLK